MFDAPPMALRALSYVAFPPHAAQSSKKAGRWPPIVVNAQRDLPGLGLASLLKEAAAGRKLPPVERWNPAYCGEIDIRIARDGTWFHQGTPIGRKEIVRLFSTILRKEGDNYFLVTPVEKMRIRVDDAPFMAVLMDRQAEGPAQRLVFTTNVGDEIVAGENNPIRVADQDRPAPYIHVRRGLEARISRNVFYQLVDIAVPADDRSMMGVWSEGKFFVLGSAE
jgi:uncharacterized protein